MKDTELIQWILDHKRLLISTQRPTKEELLMVFKIANIVDETQTHKPSNCGRCYDNAKRAIRRNNPTLFE